MRFRDCESVDAALADYSGTNTEVIVPEADDALVHLLPTVGLLHYLGVADPTSPPDWIRAALL